MKNFLEWLNENAYHVFSGLIIVSFFIGIVCIVLQFSERISLIEEDANILHTEYFYLEDVKLETTIGGELSGSAILGLGDIDGSFGRKTYYTGYKIEENGGKTFFRMDAEKVRVFETLEDGDQIYVEIDENGHGIQEVRLYTPEGYF